MIGGVPTPEQEAMRKRVSELSEHNNKYTDAVWDIARTEDSYRDDLRKEGLTNTESVARLADRFSDEALKAMEADQKKWLDDMTGLRNRNAYKHEAPQVFALERREQTDGKPDRNACSYLMVDFDHFKMVNDNFGHPAGDQALKRMAKILSDTVRTSDIVYRIGGEEFLILLPSTDSTGAQIIAEKIRESVERTPITITTESGNAIDLNKTVSIGCIGTDQLPLDWQAIAASEKDSSPETTTEIAERTAALTDKMYAYADLAVYASKKDGRNRVTVFSEELLKKEGSEVK